MAHAGDVIENPVVGGRIIFRKTARETNGELLQFDAFSKPHGLGPLYHIHARQEERFEVISGTARFRVAGNEQSLRAGQILVGPPGIPHSFWNDGDDELHVRIEFRPALKQESYLETIFGLARDGKTNKRGVPNLLQAVLLSREYEFFLAGPPIFLQRALIAVLAPIARLLGYRARYPEYSGPE